jgi:hypothetical protein
MKYKSVIFLVIACSLAACNWGVPGSEEPAITKDTLKYSYKIIKQKATDCGNKPDSGCTVVQIKYPVFAGHKVLNDTINQNLLASFKLDDKKPDSSLQQLAHHFLMLYEDDKRVNKRPDLIYALDSKTSIIRQDSSLLTLQFTQYSYMGGAHGGSSISFVNWDTKANKKVALNAIFIDGYAGVLNKIAEKIFRKQEKLADTASLNGYFFKDNKFSLNDNYLVSPIGIRFHYNDYEIKPYAAGPTDLLIPYSQIESLLRPNSVITQYIQ